MAGLLHPHALKKTCSALDSAVSIVRASVQGKAVKLPIDLILMESLPPFEQKVLRTVQNIPRGKVSSYKLIAKKAGRPGASRAVGNAMAKNPFPLIIPCHRVLRSDGEIGGFQSGPEIKKRLLKMEGIEFDRNNRVLRDHFY